MKKPNIDLAAPVAQQITAIKEVVEIVTGKVGGKIANTKGILSPSVGIDVAAGAGTLVTKKAEFDQLVLRLADVEAKLNALINRLNTP